MNLSGFSPLSLKTSSPSFIKSPGKDYGIYERIEVICEKLIAGYDRWILAKSNGVLIVEVIHNLKEKSRVSGGSSYPDELETYCNKLKVAKSVMQDVKRDSASFLKEINGSLSILKTMDDNDELEAKLVSVKTFISSVIDCYESELKIKSNVLENIAHVSTSHESQILIASWCYTTSKELECMFLRLKISPASEQWSCPKKES